MTDRIDAFVVVLVANMREDDARATITALEQIKGVLKVTPHVAGISEIVAEQRVRHELGRKLFEILYGHETPG